MTTAVVESISLVATAIAVAGVWLNNSRLKACFVLWGVSNSLSMGLHLHAGLWSLAGRDCIFLVLAVHGWRAWGRSRP